MAQPEAQTEWQWLAATATVGKATAGTRAPTALGGLTWTSPCEGDCQRLLTANGPFKTLT